MAPVVNCNYKLELSSSLFIVASHSLSLVILATASLATDIHNAQESQRPTIH